MVTIRSYVFARLAEGAVPAGLLVMTDEPRNQFSTFAYDHLRPHGSPMEGQGWRLSQLYDVVPKPQVELERGLVLSVGPAGRDVKLTNALAGAAAFGPGAGEPAVMVEALRAVVGARWEPLFAEAGLAKPTGADLQPAFGWQGNLPEKIGAAVRSDGSGHAPHSLRCLAE